MPERVSTDDQPWKARARLGRVGIWSLELRFGDPGQISEAAAELDELGFGALWAPGGVGGDVFGAVGRLLAATKTAVIATGIINVWKHEPSEIGDWWQAQPDDRRRRLLLGLGVSHGPLIGEAYGKPLAVMGDYLDRLSAQGVPAQHLCIAALRSKMLALAAARTAGSHPYLVTPEHTAMARKALGPDALLAPEQGVVMETDPGKARAIARQAVEHYRQLPNYVASWLDQGFPQAEIDNASDRLVDALFAWGGLDRIAERVNAHLAAGADHVCLQVLTGAAAPDFKAARPAWRELATALL